MTHSNKKLNCQVYMLNGKKKGLLCLLIGLLGKQNIIEMSSPITYYSMHKATMINIYIGVTDHSN